MKMVDRMSYVVIEKFSNVVPTSAEVGSDIVEDCFQDCGVEDANAVTCESV